MTEKHVYLSQPDMEHLVLKYRGLAGEKEDIDSFAKMMAKSGHKVAVFDSYQGNAISLQMAEEKLGVTL